jgi:chemotaxis protein MotB
MQRTLWYAALVTLVISLGACGIPEETHDAVKKDLDQCMSDLANSKNSLQTTEQERDKLKTELDSMGAKRDQLAKRLGATKKEIEQLRKARSAAEKRNATFRKLLARLKSMIDAGKLKVEIRKGRMIVKMSDKILFDAGKMRLKKEGKAALKQLAAVLKDIGDRDFLVAGHTDNVPIKTRRFRSNWELSAARAVNVVKYMQGEGVDPKHLAAAGYSEYDPVGDNSKPEGKRTNRRIEFVLMPNLGEMPGMPKMK